MLIDMGLAPPKDMYLCVVKRLFWTYKQLKFSLSICFLIYGRATKERTVWFGLKRHWFLIGLWLWKRGEILTYNAFH